MPRLYYRKARNNIYAEGVKFPDPRTKSGFRRDKSKPADKQDKLLVARGEHYYTWQFKNSPPVISKTKPKRSQLTRSEFLGWLYDFEDDTLANFSPDSPEDLESQIQDLISELEEQRDELQSRLENMKYTLKISLLILILFVLSSCGVRPQMQYIKDERTNLCFAFAADSGGQADFDSMNLVTCSPAVEAAAQSDAEKKYNQ